MAHYKMNSNRSKYYPVAVAVGKPVETLALAKMIAKRCSFTVADVCGALRALSEAVAECLGQGKAVHLDGFGHFKLKLNSKAVDSPEEFNFNRHVTAVRVQFLPERRRTLGKKRYTRELLDLEKIKWHKVP